MDPITQQAALGAAGAGGADDALYADDVFSTFLYQGNGSSKSINNGIDLSGEGGLTIIRTMGAGGWRWVDTERGATKRLGSQSTSGENTDSEGLTSFTSTGFNLGGGGDYNDWNAEFHSFSFRKAPGFFDVVTWTGNNVNGRDIAHSLDSVPGCIILKRTDTSDSKGWSVFHRGLSVSQYGYPSQYLKLNSSDSAFNDTGLMQSYPTSTSFNVSLDFNANGATYVAYIFAHDAQSFGENGNESIIACGTYTGNSSYPKEINLGWEPQWLFIKRTDGSAPWLVMNTMKGIHSGDTEGYLNFASTSSESSTSIYNGADVTSSGFNATGNGGWWTNNSSGTYIYMAIRRPHKKPDTGTEVYQSYRYWGLGSEAFRTVSFPVDALLSQRTTGGNQYFFDRMRGGYKSQTVNSYTAETTETTAIDYFGNDYIKMDSGIHINGSSHHYLVHMFKRAPGFFDVVGYEGNGSSRVISHNLEVAPELLITKCRSHSNTDFLVGVPDTGKWYKLDSSNGYQGNLSNYYTSITSTGYTVPTYSNINGSGRTYYAYLFATLPGVSKVGTYTGTGSDINVDCGFTTGARFILIKRHDSSGNWIVFNSASGIVQNGNDPYMSVNSTSAEQTGENRIEPLNSGFTVKSTAGAALNQNANTYIFLAIA